MISLIIGGSWWNYMWNFLGCKKNLQEKWSIEKGSGRIIRIYCQFHPKSIRWISDRLNFKLNTNPKIPPSIILDSKNTVMILLLVRGCQSLTHIVRRWNQMDVAVIGYPYGGGQTKKSVENSPRFFRESGLIQQIEKMGRTVIDYGDCKVLLSS